MGLPCWISMWPCAWPCHPFSLGWNWTINGSDKGEDSEMFQKIKWHSLLLTPGSYPRLPDFFDNFELWPLPRESSKESAGPRQQRQVACSARPEDGSTGSWRASSYHVSAQCRGAFFVSSRMEWMTCKIGTTIATASHWLSPFTACQVAARSEGQLLAPLFAAACAMRCCSNMRGLKGFLR